MSQSYPDPKYYESARAALRGFLPATYSRVLKEGCGHGGFRANLGEAEVWGGEPVAGAARFSIQYGLGESG